MRNFIVPTKPYDFRLYSRKEVSFNPGFTALVGCNGSGKSTLMHIVHDQLCNGPDILALKYDDRIDGGDRLAGRFGFYGDTANMASMIMSSEGEKILHGICHFVSSLKHKIDDANPKEIWIFMDAVGSGLSIDGIDELKDLYQIIQDTNPERDVYFVVSTNEYEFARDSDCIDVTTFKHMTFATYDEYRNYILKTSQKKIKENIKRYKND